MCYFNGLRAKRRVVSKRRPVRGWKVLRSGYRVWRPLIMSGRGVYGEWERATAHGFYVFASRADAEQYQLHWSGGEVACVQIAGKVRDYCHTTRPGYRAEWMKVSKPRARRT